MKKSKIIVLFIFFLILPIYTLYSVESSKPDSHNTSWIKLHGQASKVNEEKCLACHNKRDDCIRCHQDTAPRSHTPSWRHRTHGIEARWNRDKCMTCHNNAFCEECHTSQMPMSHRRANFIEGGHCYTECHSPNLRDNKCIICHKSYHGPQGPR
ncbi:MAG: hypothetical protein SVN78_08840 [Deferribacterota bacterium]|nr:hypothetical protein [Deferribacterota bacterium]